MLILVSNDDGIQSTGIQELARRLKHIAEVVVVAPDREQSASSHSLTLHRPLRIEKVKENQYAINGTPTDCVMLGINQILKRKPDLVVSGINRGANLGYDVHYSGTVSAAMEGAIMGVPALAVSLVMQKEPFHFSSAATFALKLAKKVLKEKMPAGMMLNINVPNLPLNEIQGYQYSILGKRNYGDVVVEKIDPRGRNYYWIGGDAQSFHDIPHSDCNSVSEHYVSITPLKVDLVDHPFLEKIRSWKI